MQTMQILMEKTITFGESSTAQADISLDSPLEKNQNPRGRTDRPAESTFISGESPTAKGGFLPTLSADQAQYPIKSPISYQVRFSVNLHRSQEPNFGGGPTRYGL